MASAADLVYAAEDNVRRLLAMVSSSSSSSVEFLNSRIEVEPVVVFGHIDHALRYTQRVAMLEELAVSVRVMDADDNHSVGAFHHKNTISFNPEAEHLDQLLALHEIAHARSGNRHGNAFIDAYVDLVRRYIGFGVALILDYELRTARGKSVSGKL